MDKTLIIFPKTHKHLGLFDDLKDCSDIILRSTEFRPVKKVYSLFQKLWDSRTLNRFINFPNKYKWYEYYDIYDITKDTRSIIVFDGALNTLKISELLVLKKRNSSLRFYLYFINSLNADSPGIKEVRHKYLQFPWDKIFTFDASDARRYGLTYLGFNYYSKHRLNTVENPAFDAYFIGGNKGNRIGLIVDVFNFLNENGVKCNFILYLYKGQTNEYIQGIKYINNSWLPYEEILKQLQNCKCIIEIMQSGQDGPSLRYMEAVCYNKKLLTNNPHIVDYPLYDSRYMKIFKNIRDIDPKWLDCDEKVDYHYNNEFSPMSLVEYVNNLAK